ncbi:MAG: CDP-alcohol phosphatidyltransferase family protein [Gemmatimonadales bacterium]
MLLIPSFLRKGFEALLSPLVDWLIAKQVHPNVLTTLGTVVLLAASVAFGVGFVRLGGLLLLLSGVFDMLDGRVARGGDVATKFGAFYDSTLDRVGDASLYGGIALYFIHGPVPAWLQVPGAAVGMVALAAALIVSYARARAEGLGLECKVGIAQRAERILVLGVPSLFLGAGPQGILLFSIVFLLALMAVVTIAQRMRHVYRTTRRSGRKTQSRRAPPALAEFTGKGRSSDRFN